MASRPIDMDKRPDHDHNDDHSHLAAAINADSAAACAADNAVAGPCA